MKPTITDELLACMTQLNADIADIADALEYIRPVQERLQTLLEQLQDQKETA